MDITLDYLPPQAAVDGADTIMIIGRRGRLEEADVQGWLPAEAKAVWEAMLESASPGDKGAAASTWCAGPLRVIAGVLPEPCSRHNSPARPHGVSHLVRTAAPKKGKVAILLATDEDAHVFAAGTAVARGLHAYDRKRSRKDGERCSVRVAALGAHDDRLEAVAGGIQLAMRLTDMPTSELDTKAFVEFARDVAARFGGDITVLEDEALAHAGLGGIWGVGKAAVNGPALVVLDHNPAGARKTLAWVGKGIVYDTGGLSIKGKDHMPGMKADMAGAAAVLGAFRAAVELKSDHRIVALLCLAENAVGPHSTRPDDILEMYSGKTVEVNNTDAEGRLVLADGVAYAGRHFDPAVIMDLATLTGAQLVSTGRRHAGLVCNDDALEALAIKAGKRSGDLCHPLPYCPEFFRSEFKSEVADLKNSVKDRMNAQSSCAGQFVAEHLGDYDGPWLHIDLAGPSGEGERGTGFGVALLVDMLEDL